MTGFTDEKDSSRTIRTGFTDRNVVSHDTQELQKDALSCTKAYIRDTWLGFC